ncbi:cysteine-type peptidase [Thecamonas trahens ATCC 50062]|uniref:Cysteine-type peptidase n=1 Tax=Thecamonas trahens ATCC 50062 TaxID=461836 RepID=A0A0L0DTW6_THETB|nr:cysteine-type peptidase [Thecamonas trahens ATCC 50062]KNC55491.1 cysteine-type peptidase [Thecamonas trahens ATCC 50062]|eukprot:XP_013761271.1 cysteine-type peptidase [Thecamonas trahens ATCC 50062]
MAASELIRVGGSDAMWVVVLVLVVVAVGLWLGVVEARFSPSLWCGRLMRGLSLIGHPGLGEEAMDEDELEWWAHRIRLDEGLRRDQLAEYDIEPDGNCQFVALGQQLFGSLECGAWVRATVLDHILAHPEAFAGFVPGGSLADLHKHVRSMRTRGAWGDHLTLTAAAQVWGARIEVVTSAPADADDPDNPAAPLVIEPPGAVVWPRTLRLSHIAHEHFNSVFDLAELRTLRLGLDLPGWNDANLGPRPSWLSRPVVFCYSPDRFAVLPDRDNGVSLDCMERLG